MNCLQAAYIKPFCLGTDLWKLACQHPSGRTSFSSQEVSPPQTAAALFQPVTSQHEGLVPLA